MKKYLVIIICFWAYTSAGQLIAEVDLNDGKLKRLESTFNQCTQSGVHNYAQFKECAEPIITLYNQVSDSYYIILKQYLIEEDRASFMLLDSLFLASFIQSKILSKQIYGSRGSLALGEESKISSIYIELDFLRNRHQYLRSYIYSICERKEEPCVLFKNK